MRRAAALALVGLVVACAGRAGPPPPPSRAEALQHLERIIALVQTGDLRNLCDLGGPTCPMSIDSMDPRTVPRGRPTIAAMRTLEAVDNGDGSWSGAGVIIELCGIDGLGKLYHSDMLIARVRGQIVATEPAYWLGIKIASDPVVGPPSGPPEACRAR